MRPDVRHPRIVIVGGGFVGLLTADRLRCRLHPREAELVLVTPRNFMTYQPFLAEAAAGSLEPRHVAVPLRRVLPGVEVLNGRVTGVVHGEHRITVQPAAGPAYEVTYDHLVLAVGSVTRQPPIAGLAEAGTGFKTIEEAITLRNHVLGQLDLAETTRDLQLKRRALTFVFAGGGFAGVEALGELEDMARSVCRHYRRVRPAGMHWVLVEAGGRILPEVSEEISRYALTQLRGRGIDVRLRTRVTAIDGEVLQLSDGTELTARTLVWTAGVQPNPMLRNTDLPLNEAGRVRVGADLRVVGTRDVWGAGDCAAVPDLTRPGATTAPTAQHAVREARRLAANLAAVLHGEPVHPYVHRYAGTVGSMGLHKGIAEVYGVKMRGWPAWALHRGYHWWQMPTLNRKVRIGLDWALASMFQRDMVALGTTGGPERVGPPALARPRSAEGDETACGDRKE